MAERSGHARLPLVAVFLGIVCAAPAAADEWPSLRGPNHDGSAHRGSRFAAGPGAPVVRWRARLGSGYSGVAVSGGRAVTMFSDGGDDVLAAFDEASGKELWRIRIAERYKGINGSFDGPISTPTVAGGRVFALGPAGHLLAADLAKGRLLWRVDLPVREGARKPELGFASSPMVAGGVLVVQIGAALGRAIAGFDPSTGQRRWTVGDDAVQYQSPVVVRAGDRDIVVAVGDARLIGIDPATGRVLFDHPHGGEPVWISVASAVPMPAGNGRLFVKTHVDKSTMYRLVEAADGRISLQTLWTAPVLRQTYAVPVYHDGHLYGMNGRTVLTCVDAETGEMKWRTREPGDGFPTLVGDQIVFVTKAHTLHVGPASPQGWKERARLELFDDLSWTAPTVAGDSVFARSLGELVRVDWKTEPARTTATATPAGPTIASPTLARFLEEVERAPDKAAAVDRFLAGVGGGPLIDPPDRVVFLYRGPAKDVAIASDLLGIRREDPCTGCLGPISSTTRPRSSPPRASVTSSSRTSGDPCPMPATHAACPAPSRTRRPPRWRCPGGSNPRTWRTRPKAGAAAWRRSSSPAACARVRRPRCTSTSLPATIAAATAIRPHTCSTGTAPARRGWCRTASTTSCPSGWRRRLWCSTAASTGDPGSRARARRWTRPSRCSRRRSFP